MSEEVKSARSDEQAQINRDEDDIGFIDLAIVLAKHKNAVLGLPVLAGVVALVVALLLPKIYTATAKIMPPQQKESSAAAMLGTLGGTAGAAGATVGQALGLRNPNDLYASVLKSRTIADHLIERFKLKDLYESPNMVSARKALEKVTRISAGRDGLITIEVDDEDPKRAADLANAYVDELDRLMQSLALTEASQRRLFFEKQLANTRDQLIAAEATLRQAIEAKGITGVDAQSRGMVSTSEQLRAQIAVKEIQLDAMRSFATERNPEAVRLRQELTSMKGELANLEGGRREANGAKSPTGLENVRKLREVKFLEFSAELLTKQYEIARIDEAKDAVLIQLVDKAVPPDYRSKPSRALIVLFSVLAAFVVGIAFAIAREYWQGISKGPGQLKVRELHSLLSWQRRHH
jgi:uncharacterized protein involved in exopolysaccharide biosynthesis